MRTPSTWLATSLVAAAVCCTPVLAAAHTGGALDAEGCHADHRKGSYHCHRGEAAGYTFPNRAAMEEAVRTGNYPEKSVDEEGFFQKLWPWGSKHEQQEAAPEADKGSADAPVAAPAAGASAPAPRTDTPAADSAAAPASASPPSAGAATAPAGPQNEYERRLKVLQGLYEMGLISREEYEAKRKEVLGQL